MWEWLTPGPFVRTRTEKRLFGSVTITERGMRRPDPPPLPELMVAVDIETTGLHSTDRIVSLGAVWVSREAILEGCLNPSFIHLIFDPGRKSHPKAEEVHGFDDWMLRHQDPFSEYAADVAGFLNSGDVVIAHNATFDMGFITREIGAAGYSLEKPVCCTMEGYRASCQGGSASLTSACTEMGLQRAGQHHGALEDAWLALMLFLWLHDYQHCRQFNACGAHLDLFNIRAAPPRPEGAIPRRRAQPKPRP